MYSILAATQHCDLARRWWTCTCSVGILPADCGRPLIVTRLGKGDASAAVSSSASGIFSRSSSSEHPDCFTAASMSASESPFSSKEQVAAPPAGLAWTRSDRAASLPLNCLRDTSWPFVAGVRKTSSCSRGKWSSCCRMSISRETGAKPTRSPQPAFMLPAFNDRSIVLDSF